MLITPANLQIVFTTIGTQYKDAFTAEVLTYPKVCTTYPVSSENWINVWIPMTDKLREWDGARIVRTPAPQTYFVPIKPFEATYGVDKFKVLDDTWGVYTPVVQRLGQQAAKWPDYQLRDLLQNQGAWTGAFQNGTDGLTGFNTAHLVDFYDASKGTYCNDYTGGGFTVNSVNVGGALSINAFATVYEDMMRRKSESGESQEVMPNLAMVAPPMKLPLDVILQAQFLGNPQFGSLGSGSGGNAPFVGTTENVMKSWTDELVWRDIGGSTSIGGGTYDQVWYMMDTSKAIKPFSWLLRQAPSFAFLINPNDPVVFETHTFQYGVDARGSVAWGLPFLFARSGP